MSRVAALAFAALVSSGCIDISKEFSDFTDRTNQLDMAVEMTDAGPSMIHDISGQFMLTLAAAVSPDQPLLFLMDVTLTKKDDGTAVLDSTMKPLHAATKKPIGMGLSQTGTIVMSDGTFSIHQPGDVPGDANPITGADLTVDVFLNGVIRSANRFCGDATGYVTKPTMLDLAGSKWAAVRVKDGDPLPAPDVSCKAEDPMPDLAMSPDMTELPDMLMPDDAAEQPDL